MSRLLSTLLIGLALVALTEGAASGQARSNDGIRPLIDSLDATDDIYLEASRLLIREQWSQNALGALADRVSALSSYFADVDSSRRSMLEPLGQNLDLLETFLRDTTGDSLDVQLTEELRPVVREVLEAIADDLERNPRWINNNGRYLKFLTIYQQYLQIRWTLSFDIAGSADPDSDDSLSVELPPAVLARLARDLRYSISRLESMERRWSSPRRDTTVIVLDDQSGMTLLNDTLRIFVDGACGTGGGTCPESRNGMGAAISGVVFPDGNIFGIGGLFEILATQDDGIRILTNAHLLFGNLDQTDTGGSSTGNVVIEPPDASLAKGAATVVDGTSGNAVFGGELAVGAAIGPVGLLPGVILMNTDSDRISFGGSAHIIFGRVSSVGIGYYDRHGITIKLSYGL